MIGYYFPYSDEDVFIPINHERERTETSADVTWRIAVFGNFNINTYREVIASYDNVTISLEYMTDFYDNAIAIDCTIPKGLAKGTEINLFVYHNYRKYLTTNVLKLVVI